MKNAHLRFGWPMYVKRTEKTTTSIKLRLDRFIGEMLPDPRHRAKAHLISGIGGDTQIAAISAAISLGDRFRIEGPEISPIRVCLERNPQCFKGSIQIPGRKKPLRHLIGMSDELISANRSANTGRLLLAGTDKQFIWASLAQIYGKPGGSGMGGLVRTGTKHSSCHRADVEPGRDQRAEGAVSRLAQLGVESGAVRFPSHTARFAGRNRRCGKSWDRRLPSQRSCPLVALLEEHQHLLCGGNLSEPWKYLLDAVAM